MSKSQLAKEMGQSSNGVIRLLNDKQSQDSRGRLTPIVETSLSGLGYKLALRPGGFDYDLYDHIKAELRAEIKRRNWTIAQTAQFLSLTPKALSRMLSTKAKDKRGDRYASWQTLLRTIEYELYVVKTLPIFEKTQHEIP